MFRGLPLWQSPVDIPIAMGDPANEESLVEKAREAIRGGKLPARRPDRIFGGPGSQIGCAVCDELIPRSELELEVEFKRHGVNPGLDSYHIHPRCFAAWETALSSPDSATT